jgi:hypothetical protein
MLNLFIIFVRFQIKDGCDNILYGNQMKYYNILHDWLNEFAPFLKVICHHASANHER